MNCQNNFNFFIFVTTYKMTTFDLNIKCIAEFHLQLRTTALRNVIILILQVKILGVEEVNNLP